jgi:glucokinase
MPLYVFLQWRICFVENACSGLFAGVDFGGTKIAAVIADDRGNIVAEGVIPTRPSDGPDQAVERTNRLLDDLCRQHSLDILAMGIGLPGLVDRDAGTILFLPNLPQQWCGFGIAKAFASPSQRPVFLLNDARMATLGEYTFGDAGGSQDMLFITAGTGIGGGLVLDGKLRFGAFGAAGEIGHQTILPDGVPCSCGSRGCLETLFSGPALAATGRALMSDGRAPRLSELVAGDPARVTATRMAVAARSGDSAVADAIRLAAQYLGVGVANAVTITAVHNVVIGGGLSVLGDLILEPVRQEVHERVRMFPSEVVRISCSTLGDKCGALGGVALAVQEYNLKTCITSA